MKKERFISTFSNPDAISQLKLEELESLVADYPFSALVRMLYVKSLKSHDDIRFEDELRIAAAHAPSRERLYHWLKETPVVQFEPAELVEVTEAVEVLETKQAEPKQDEVAPKQAPKKELDAELDFLQRQYLTEAVETSLGMEIDQELEQAEASQAPALVTDKAQDEVQTLPKQEDLAEDEVEELAAPASFLDFISGSATEPNTKVKKPKNDRAEAIIDQFISNEKKEKVEFFDPERMARASLVDNEELVTETLARIYANQGNYKKAKRAYASLQLKYPEKRVYFAAQIKKVEDLMKK